MKPLIQNFTNYKLSPIVNDANLIVTIQDGIKELFQDDNVLEFHPERRLSTDMQVMIHLSKILKGYERGTRYDTFFFDKTINKCIGEIDIVTNKGLLEYYPFFNEIIKKYPIYKNTWLIEYYLRSDYWNIGLMSVVLKEVVKHIFNNGVQCISAVTNNGNFGSVRILQKLGFKQAGMFNKEQTHWVLLKEQ